MSMNTEEIREACDEQAKKFYAGGVSVVAIDCAPRDCLSVMEYMKANHPTVKYAYGPGSAAYADAINKLEEA